MKKFRIPANPHRTNKSISFPDDLIMQIENAIVGANCTFSAFVVASVRYVLENDIDKS